MPDATWPSYRVGNPDYIHALGVIASIYNLLEFRFRSLFSIYVQPTNFAYKLFHKTNNHDRQEFIREALDFSSHPEAIKDEVRHFLDAYRICTDNRNIFMHSTVMFVFGPGDTACPELSPPNEQPQGLAFQKSPRGDPFQINTYQVTIEQIREQADALKAFEMYGDRLFYHILKNYEPARYATWRFPDAARFELPIKPVLPSRLVPKSPDMESE